MRDPTRITSRLTGHVCAQGRERGCREIKAGSEFGRRSGDSSSLDTICKPCRREANRLRRRRARLSRSGPRVQEKHCPRCGATKAAAELYVCTSSRTGLSFWCWECFRAAQRGSIEIRDRRGRLLERGVLVLTRSARELARYGDEDLAGACVEYSRGISAGIEGGEAMSIATNQRPVTAAESCMINGCNFPAIAGDVLCRDHDRRYRRSCPFCGKRMQDAAIARGACGCCWQKTWVKEATRSRRATNRGAPAADGR